MNYLAHIYLSGNDPDLIFGNFIADAIPGKQYKNYSNRIQEGIILHREIDSFTDQHPIFRKSKKLLTEDHGHYSGVLVDMFYDHFLAALWQNYHSESLELFSQLFYKEIESRFELLPDKMKRAFPYMKTNNWLLQYKTLEGLEIILGQMERRTRFKSNFKASINTLKKHYPVYENDFCVFFEDIKMFVSSKIS
jgi:acyl carrier protein phosphodiesterase